MTEEIKKTEAQKEPLQDSPKTEVKKKNLPAFLGIKVGMTRIFTEEGKVIPVTAILAGPCKVVQFKTAEKNGGKSVQLGIGSKREKNLTKPEKGHLVKHGVEGIPRWIREVKVPENVTPEDLGKEIRVEEIFSGGEEVKVQGVSKGKGFEGVVTRWHFKGGPKTHGQSDRERSPGSIGPSSFPSKVWKGTRMAGRKGGNRVSVKNLSIVKVIPEENLLLVRGSVPGPADQLLVITKV